MGRRLHTRERLTRGQPIVWVGATYVDEDIDGKPVSVRAGDVGEAVLDHWPTDLTVSFPAVGAFTCQPSDVLPDDPSIPRRDDAGVPRLAVFSPELAAEVLRTSRDEVIVMLADGILGEDEAGGCWGISRSSVEKLIEFRRSAPFWRRALRFVRRNIYV